MVSKMRAAVFVEKGRIVLQDKPIPRPGHGAALAFFVGSATKALVS